MPFFIRLSKKAKKKQQQQQRRNIKGKEWTIT